MSRTSSLDELVSWPTAIGLVVAGILAILIGWWGRTGSATIALTAWIIGLVLVTAGLVVLLLAFRKRRSTRPY